MSDKFYKGYLCIFDVRNIQKFIFSTPYPHDVRSASAAITGILQKSLDYSYSQLGFNPNDKRIKISFDDPDEDIDFFDFEDLMLEVVVISAGNAFLLIRTEELFNKLTQYMTRYFLEFGSSLGLAVSHVKISKVYEKDIAELYQKLDINKVSDSVFYSQPALPIVKTEKFTGLPAVGTDEHGEYISRDTLNKHKLGCEILEKVDDLWDDEFFDIHDKIAYVHIDGNSLGKSIAKIHGAYSSYIDGLKAYRQIDTLLSGQYMEAFHSALAVTFKEFVKNNPQYKIENDYIGKHDILTLNNPLFRFLNIGGDDINLVIMPQYAFFFCEAFVKKIGKYIIWQSDTEVIRNSVCAGIAFVESEISMGYALGLAMECCENAKKRAKLSENLINGTVGNWIDFETLTKDNISHLDSLRKSNRSTDDKYYLRKRPYCLDSEFEDSAFSYKDFMTKLNVIQSIKFTEEDKEVLLDWIAQGFRFHGYFMHFISAKHSDLVKDNPGGWCKINDDLYSDWYDVMDIVKWHDNDVRYH